MMAKQDDLASLWGPVFLSGVNSLFNFGGVSYIYIISLLGTKRWWKTQFLRVSGIFRPTQAGPKTKLNTSEIVQKIYPEPVN